MSTTTQPTHASTPSTPRTVAQALRRIKQLKGSLKEHESRANEAVSYVENKKPKFGFKEEKAARAKAQDELVRLESAVAVANASKRVTFEGRDLTVAEAIRRLQETKADIAWLSGLQIREGVEETTDKEWDEDLSRNVRRQKSTTYVTDLSVTERVAEVEALRARFERLNDAVETANHRTTIKLEVVETPTAS